MKKLTMICMSALLMLAVSCKKDKKTEIENAGSGFRATVESHEGTGKTHLDDKAVKWDSGDAILVKSSTCTTPKRFTTTGTDASASFVAAESLDEDFYTPDYTGYYPASAFSGAQLKLPATQTYVAGSFGNGANPMAALSSSTTLPFKNVCGVLKLQLYSATACQVRSISITSNTGELLYGTGAVGFDAADDNDNPTLGALTGGGSTLTLNCNGALMSTESAEPSTYFFVVPVGTLGTSFTVKVTDTDGKVWTKTANSSANRIARSQITKMPELPVTVTHEYVDLGLSVKWATCNLGATNGATAESWYGDYYQWGGVKSVTSTTINVDWYGCPHTIGTYSSTNKAVFTKYIPTGKTDYWAGGGDGPDGLTTLLPVDDAATQEWGSAWRMPTETEFQELKDNTTRTWYAKDNTDFNGVAGWKCVSTKAGYTDKYIFLPAAGYRGSRSLYSAGTDGTYWTSSVDETYPTYGRYCVFSKSSFGVGRNARKAGSPVRAVCLPQN